MKKKMTIDKVAELAYVSRSVVSRVLNNHPNVSEEARARVEKVIEEHNYRPSSAARSLATDRTFEICILTPRRKGDALANGFWTLLHLGIFEQCIERGYFVSLSMVSSEIGQEVHEHILSERRFDGFILITEEVTNLVADALDEREVPTMLIGHDPERPGLSSVDVDNYRGAYEATTHLCRLGHKRVGAMFGSMELKESVERKEGYSQALKDAGRTVDANWSALGDYSQESGYQIMQQWIEEGAPPPACFCANDGMAIGALLAIHQAGLSVPDDVAIVGFDDLPTSRYAYPPLTTVHQPIREKGERAADMLIDQVEGKSSAVRHIELPGKLVVRESCGAASADA
jgi:LacI family transcriptional regulator